MTMPQITSSRMATTISAVRLEKRGRPSSALSSLCMMALSFACNTSGMRGLSRGRRAAPTRGDLLRQEARFLHQVEVLLVGVGDPGLELVTGHEGLIEG